MMRLWSAIALVVLTACFNDPGGNDGSGSDDSGMISTDTDDSDGDGDGDGDCDCGSGSCSCLPAVSSDWTAVLLAQGSGLDCPDEFPLQKIGGTNIESEGCECNCDTPESIECAAQIRSWPVMTSDCSGEPGSIITNTTCFKSSATSGSSWLESVVTPGSGSCEATATALGAAIEDPVTICQATQAPGACGDGQCVADAPSFQHCVMSVEPDVSPSCPTGYSEFTEYYLDFDDTVDCSAAGCNCDAPEGATCTVSGEQCDYVTACSSGCTPLAEETCVVSNQKGIHVTEPGTASGGSCAVSGSPTATGAVTPKDRHVVCCVAP